MPVISNSKILVSSSEVILDRISKEAPSLHQLKKDETVVAKVLRVVSDRRALLMINGQRVYAKTFLPLQSDQSILLKVQQTGTRQILKFLGRPEDVQRPDLRILMGSFGKARPYVMLSQLLSGLNTTSEAGAQALSEPLAAVDRLVTSMSLRAGIPVDGFLQRIMNGSGLLWESKLASALFKGEAPTPATLDALVAGDLKALMSQLLSAGTGTLPETLSEQFKGILNGIEQHQLLNQHLFDSAGRCLLPIPVMWPSALKFGQLFLDLGNKKGGEGGENRVVTICFLLSLTRLGELRADFSVYKKGITGAFGVMNEESRMLIASHLPELKRRLREHGFIAHDISCQVLTPERLSEVSLLEKAVSPPDGLLNLVV